MKTTFKHISLFAFGIAAIALLTSARLTSATAVPAPTTVTLKTVTVPSAILVAGKDGDGQESHGEKGKKGG